MHWAFLGIGAAALVVSILAIVLGTRGQNKLKKMKGTSTSTAAEAAAAARAGGGSTVELFGKVEAAEPLIAPASGTRCVFYRHKVEELVETMSYDSRAGYDRPSREWRTVSDKRKFIPFWLRDSSGAIAVNPQGAELIARQNMHDAPGGFQGADGDQESKGVLGTLAGTLLSGSAGQRRQSEWVVATGIPVYVLGDVVTTAGGPVVQKGADDFIVSWKSEEELGKSFTWKSTAWIAGGILAVLLGGAGIFYGITNKTKLTGNGPGAVLILAGAIVLAGLGYAIFSFMPQGLGRMQLGTPGGDPWSVELMGAPGIVQNQPEMTQAPAGGDFVSCPSCRVPVPRGAAACPHCMWNLNPAEMAVAPSVAPGPGFAPAAAPAGGALGAMGAIAGAGVIGSMMNSPEFDGMTRPTNAVKCPHCGIDLAPKITTCPACGCSINAAALGAPPVRGAQDFSVPAAPGEDGGQTAAGAPAGFQQPAASPPPPAQQAQAGAYANVPPAPMDANARIGVIQHDVVIGGTVAFKAGERVEVEAESADPQRPEYKYVVKSNTLNKKFRLSDMDVFL